jgi:site-specific recombinase XerD
MDSENLVQPYCTLLEQYLDYARHERNLAENTLKAHREYVTAFLKDLAGHGVRSGIFHVLSVA